MQKHIINLQNQHSLHLCIDFIIDIIIKGNLHQILFVFC